LVYTTVSDRFIVAGRTILHSILGALERVAYNGDPLQLFIQQITYQPFISLFHMLQITDERPEFKGIRECRSLCFFIH
jgi:hypothetical protein